MNEIIETISSAQTMEMLTIAQANVIRKAIETQAQTIQEIIEPIVQASTAEINGVGQHVDTTA
jgi:hypothetical protein